MPLCRHNVGTYPETSSFATRQGALGHSRLSSLSHCGPTLTYGELIVKHSPKILAHEEKATTTAT